MFEKYLKNIYEDLSAKLNFEDKYVSIPQIREFELDDYYIKFIEADVNYLIYKDKLERFANANFDFSDEEFKSKIDELDEYYKKNAIYSKSQLLELLKTAVEIRLNILIRPLHSLVWFIYKNDLTKPLNEIFMKLDFIYDYKYITEKTKEDLKEDNQDKSNTVLISSAEFKHRIINIDLEHINNTDIDTMIDELDPVYKFFNIKNEKQESVLPVEAFIVFIDDKGYKPLAGYLEKKYMQIPDASLTKNEIKEIFSRLEESYNKYQDEDILNSTVNGFEEQINTFGDEEIAGTTVEDDMIEYEMEKNKDFEAEESKDDDLVDLNEELPKEEEKKTAEAEQSNTNNGKSLKEMMQEYLEEYEIH